jgi:hypothetical protein
MQWYIEHATVGVDVEETGLQRSVSQNTRDGVKIRAITEEIGPLSPWFTHLFVALAHICDKDVCRTIRR